MVLWCWSLLLAFVSWWVFFFWWLWLLLLFGALGLLLALGSWCLLFGALGLLGCPLCVVGVCVLAVFVFFPWVAAVCGWCLSLGTLGLLPALECFSSLWWLWLVLSLGALELQPALPCFSLFPFWLLWLALPSVLLLRLKIRLTCAGDPACWLRWHTHIMHMYIYIYIHIIYCIYIYIHPIPPNPGNFSGLWINLGFDGQWKVKPGFTPENTVFGQNPRFTQFFCGCEEIQMNLTLRLCSFDLTSMGSVWSNLFSCFFGRLHRKW